MYAYAHKFLLLKEEGFVPLKVHKGEILKVKCSFCGATMAFKEKENHFCTGNTKNEIEYLRILCSKRLLKKAGNYLIFNRWIYPCLREYI